MTEHFKPWGEFEWLISKCSIDNYSIIACLSTEERCVETVRLCLEKSILHSAKIFEIIDPDDTQIHKDERKKNFDKLDASVIKYIQKYNLLDPIDTILKDITAFLNISNGNIILDISSFPKRYFFPITKHLLRSKKVDNLLITCTTPKEYTEDNLSEDPLDWSHLPTFTHDDPEEKVETAIVGIGFMPLGLPHLLKDKYSQLDVRFFFPFPPGPPTYQRTWKFINQMNTSSIIDSKHIIRVDALSVPEAFDKICAITNKGSRKALLAPYGPKTMSFAMCLYACLTNSAAYYTQPTSYSPYYSKGISKCYGYAIKLYGNLLYSV